MRLPPTYWSSAVMYAVTFVGVAWGWALRQRGPMLVETTALAAFCSVPLLGVGWYRQVKAGRATAESEIWACLLIPYSLLLILIDPFAFVRSVERLCVQLTLLIPLLLGLGRFVRFGWRTAASGIETLLAASVALLVHGASEWDGGCWIVK